MTQLAPEQPILIDSSILDEEEEQGRSGLRGRLPSLAPLSPVPIYAGVGVTAIGFVLVIYAWAKVAGLTNVALQLPYLVSGALAGLGLIMCGVTIINIAAKRRDALARQQQTELLASALDELRSTLETRRR